MNLKKDFGLRIKELRMSKGITQYKLAEIVEIDPKHLSHIETGRSFPKADLIEKMANALDVDYTQFFNTKHLKDKKELLERTNKLLNCATDEQLQLFYKILENIIN